MTHIETLITDVLVIGGGGAATASALAASQAGASAMLAVKGSFGIPGVRGAGATSNPVGDFWTIRTIGPKGGFFNPPESILADMLQTGLGMANPELCEIFVEEAPSAIKRLKEMGMKFQSRMLATMPAHSQHKTNNIVPLQKAMIESTDIQVLQNANILDLIIDDGQCFGAVGIHDNGDRFAIRSQAVILATGGVGQLFKYSFNPPGNTGDGYAMALRAGASLTNMEFMQQGLATTWPSQGIVMLYEMEEPYRLLNCKGQAFLQDYLPETVSLKEACRYKSSHWPVSCRDPSIHIDRAIKNEAIKHGNSDNREYAPVFLDMSRAERKFMPELFPKFMHEKGIDIYNDLLQVQNHHHTSNGGIVIDKDGQTSVPRLFAVGETAAWQGADRLGGTMLGGSQVFGWRAGQKAASLSNTKHHKKNLQSTIVDLLSTMKNYKSNNTNSLNLSDTLHQLQDRMWEYLIVEKDANSLQSARQFITDTQDQINSSLSVNTSHDEIQLMELNNLLLVASAIVEAADQRKESRGSHFRSDFPQRDDNQWLTNIVIKKSSDKLALNNKWLCERHGWHDNPNDVRISPWG